MIRPREIQRPPRESEERVAAMLRHVAGELEAGRVQLQGPPNVAISYDDERNLTRFEALLHFRPASVGGAAPVGAQAVAPSGDGHCVGVCVQSMHIGTLCPIGTCNRVRYT